jgi:ABC-type protease/lipase transport system fused ATPase/permease subunit
MATSSAQGGRGIGAALAEGRSALVSTGVFSFVTNLLMLTGPLFMLQVYDRVLTSGSVPTLIALVVLIGVLYALYGFLEFIRARLMMRVGPAGR